MVEKAARFHLAQHGGDGGVSKARLIGQRFQHLRNSRFLPAPEDLHNPELKVAKPINLRFFHFGAINYRGNTTLVVVTSTVFFEKILEKNRKAEVGSFGPKRLNACFKIELEEIVLVVEILPKSEDDDEDEDNYDS